MEFRGSKSFLEQAPDFERSQYSVLLETSMIQILNILRPTYVMLHTTYLFSK
jgi:hypothetical protein